MPATLPHLATKSPRFNPLYGGAALAAFNLFFWYLLNGFTFIPIDMLDGRLILAIHEHWFQVFSGKILWSDFPIFWPLKNTLGFSDAFFLTSIPYAISRFFGADPYASFILMILSIALIGYFSFFHLLRSLLQFPPFLAAAFAFLFINSSLTQNAVAHSHPQFLLIWLIPPVGLTLRSAVLHKGLKGFAFAAFSGLWLGLLFFTGFYIPWYLFFFTGLSVTLLIFLGLLLKKSSYRSLLTSASSFLRTKEGLIKCSLFALCLALSLIPFLQLYLPVNNLYGQREWGETSITVPSFKEFFNQGTYNWMWSGLIQDLGWFPQKWPQSRSMGFGPLLFLSFILSSFYLQRQPPKNRLTSAALSILLLTTVLSLILNFRVGEFTLWKYIYQSVPGASAFRAFHRFNFVLLIPIFVLIGSALKSAAVTPKQKTFVALLFGLIILEQQSSRISDYAMSSQEASSRIDHVQPPPPDAAVFYLRTSSIPDLWQFPQLDALFIAQKYHLHTVNGYSGVYPNDWWLYDPSAPWYPKEVLRWIHLNDAQPSGLYQLDWDSGQWSQPPSATPPQVSP